MPRPHWMKPPPPPQMPTEVFPTQAEAQAECDRIRDDVPDARPMRVLMDSGNVWVVVGDGSLTLRIDGSMR